MVTKMALSSQAKGDYFLEISCAKMPKMAHTDYVQFLKNVVERKTRGKADD